MSGNNGWDGSNNPSFWKLISGMAGLPLGSPVSLASRIIKRVVNGVPPQYVASYFAKYQGQLGMFTGMFLKSPMTAGGPTPFGGLGAVPVTPPQSSKTILRV